MAHPYTLPLKPPMMQPVKHLRLQVHKVTSPDDSGNGCFDLNCDGGYGNGAAAELCTVVLSMGPEKSSSAQLFLGSEASPDSVSLDFTKKEVGSLNVSVYKEDTRIAQADIDLAQVWEVRATPSRWLLAATQLNARARLRCLRSYAIDSFAAGRASAHIFQGTSGALPAGRGRAFAGQHDPGAAR